MLFLFVIISILQEISGEVLTLNASEYARMPPLFNLEPYEPCVQNAGRYCVVTLELVSDTPSPLLELIHNYSSYKMQHFNHTLLQRGVCIKNKNYTSLDLKQTLETYLNTTIWNECELKTHVLQHHCTNEEIGIELVDILVGGIILALLLLNVAGSFYDVYTDGKGSTLFLYFSIRQNWRKLVADNEDVRLERLKGLHGLRTISTCLVIMSHAFLPAFLYVDNTQLIDEAYKNAANDILSNGSSIMQTFFVISGFLLVYNMQVSAETTRPTWKMAPTAVLVRWFRLTPAYALLLGVTVTWLRHAGSGPLWQSVVLTEVRDCEQYWWLHLLYLNNYVDGSECLAQTWYLAADTHLYTLGIIVFVTCWSTRAKVVTLSLLFVLGLVTPALHTYFEDLDAAFIGSPEGVRWAFKNNLTFNHVYKRSHTNISCYVIGLALGYIVYYAQKNNVNVEKYKRYRVVYWSLLPLGLLLTASPSLFYEERSMLVRVGFAAIGKPLGGMILACGLCGALLKFEGLYRGVLEWGGWRVFSRLSYSAYLLHVSFVRYSAGTQATTTHTSKQRLVQLFLYFLVVTYSAALLFSLLIEAPLRNLVKLGANSRSSKETVDGKPDKIVE